MYSIKIISLLISRYKNVFSNNVFPIIPWPMLDYNTNDFGVPYINVIYIR